MTGELVISSTKKSPLPIKMELSVTSGGKTVTIKDDDVTVVVRK